MLKTNVTCTIFRFYTLVPHSFGTDNPPLLNNVEIIKTKAEMLDNLLEIEIAYSLLKTGNFKQNLVLETFLKNNF